ncbi:MAG TPA: Mur ligase family protein, partial [Pyrinomonadaceae bacterium]|nr:Mur ligase family protein [Pyrinomonadaceae bacterium]
MRFEEARRYLLGLGHETLAMKLGLESVRALLDALGRPERRFFSVQIAGTNGKGSTAAMLHASACAAGLRAGLYTSPHLVNITERIRTNEGEISETRFAEVVTRVRDAAGQLRQESGALPTFFEQVTAAALLFFAEERVELAVLETGLGGRLDATTAADARVVGLTPVALDHQEHLGPTLELIAAEKAAVVRRGITEAVCVTPQAPEAEAVIRRACAEAGLEPRVSACDTRVEGTCEGGRLRATFRTRRETYEGVCLSLRGRHQLTNAALAVELAETLRDFGFPFGRERVRAGLERAEHAGRLELLEGPPA